jgi:hypothetical protein
VLWIRGDSDLIISDQSLFDVAVLGSLGAVPDWPGNDVHPAQPMTAQTRAVLERYAARGGEVREHVITDSSHSPFIDHLDDSAEVVFGFLTGP